MYKTGRQIYLGRQEIIDIRSLIELRLMTLADMMQESSASINDYQIRIDDANFGSPEDKKRWRELQVMYKEDLERDEAEQDRLLRLEKKLWYYETPEESKARREGEVDA